MVLVDIDRVLDRVAVGRPFAERHGVGVAEHDAILFRHDMRHLATQHRFSAALDVIGVGRLDVALVARIDALANVVEVDREHGGHVGVA